MEARYARPLVISFSLLTLVACETSNQQMGAIIGAAAGALAGAQVEGDNRGLAILAGTAAGAFVGGKIGSYLDEQDRIKMAEASRNAAISGETQSWSTAENKTSGEARVIASETRTETVVVPVLKERITQVPPLDIVGATYKANTQSNLRGGPGTDYVVVGSLAPGEVINVVGKVKDSEWYLVSQDGVGSGFVSAPLVDPAPNEVPAASDVAINPADVAEQQTNSSRTCRTVEQSVTLADGSSQSETIEACQGPTGWVVQS